jgi:hypothetical protein
MLRNRELEIWLQRNNLIINIKKKQDFMAKNFDFHNHNMHRKLQLNVQYCNTVLFKTSMINMGINL